MSANLCRVKRCFKPYQNQYNSVKDTGEKGKKPCNIDPKIAMKILLYYPPTFPSSNPKILKALVKTFPTKMKPSKCATKEKRRQEKRKKKGGEKAKFCFLCIPELLKLIFCIWIRRPRRVQPVNGFVVLALSIITMTRKPFN